MINIISNLKGTEPVENLCNFNHVLAYFLNIAFSKIGVESKLVDDKTYHKDPPPEADYSIMISSYSYVYFDLKRWKDPIKRKQAENYVSNIKKTTKKKIAIYTESNFPGWDKLVDVIFSVVKPAFPPEPERWWAHIEKYKYAGWAADPDIFKIEPLAGRSIFYDTNKVHPSYKKYHDIYNKVLPKMGVPIHEAKREYRLSMTDVAKLMGKSSFYCDTRVGEASLTRIEAATSGNLLVIPKPFRCIRSVDSLEHVRWETEEELIEILNTKTDPEKIREKALNHSWEKVAKRIFEGLK